MIPSQLKIVLSDVLAFFPSRFFAHHHHLCRDADAKAGCARSHLRTALQHQVPRCSLYGVCAISRRQSRPCPLPPPDSFAASSPSVLVVRCLHNFKRTKQPPVMPVVMKMPWIMEPVPLLRRANSPFALRIQPVAAENSVPSFVSAADRSGFQVITVQSIPLYLLLPLFSTPVFSMHHSSFR